MGDNQLQNCWVCLVQRFCNSVTGNDSRRFFRNIQEFQFPSEMLDILAQNGMDQTELLYNPKQNMTDEMEFLEILTKRN